MPSHHEVHARDVDLKRLGAVLAVAYERDLKNFADLLLLEKLGPRTLQSLALVAEVVHGAPSRFNDPARFAFAHGGKDGHPHPVPLKTYNESLNFLRSSLDAAKVGDREKLDGFRRLERFVRTVETELKPQADFEALVHHENAISPSLNGLLSWAVNAAIRRIKGKVLYSNLNICFEIGAAFAIFFATPTTKCPDDKRRAPRSALNCIP